MDIDRSENDRVQQMREFVGAFSVEVECEWKKTAGRSDDARRDDGLGRADVYTAVLKMIK